MGVYPVCVCVCVCVYVCVCVICFLVLISHFVQLVYYVLSPSQSEIN